jgi:hypothetical protein
MDAIQLIELEEFFERKGWTKFEGHRFALNRIGDLVSTMNEEERYIIKQILERYLWAPNEVYNSLFLRALNKIPPSKFEGKKNLIFIPIYKKTDENKIKSSLGIAYLSKAGFIKYYPRFEGLKIIPIKDHYELEKNLNNGHISLEDSLIIYCDDFIGSGETVTDCLKWVVDECRLEIKDITVLGLVGMASGFNKIIEINESCYFGETVNRAISDSFTASESSRYLDLMVEMERDVDCNNNYSLGFEKSEAAVTMIRTPNNTFPIFWNNFKRKQPFIKPIFPRF